MFFFWKKKLVSVKGKFFSNKRIFLFFCIFVFAMGFVFLFARVVFFFKIFFWLFVFAFFCKGLSFLFAKGFD